MGGGVARVGSFPTVSGTWLRIDLCLCVTSLYLFFPFAFFWPFFHFVRRSFLQVQLSGWGVVSRRRFPSVLDRSCPRRLLDFSSITIGCTHFAYPTSCSCGYIGMGSGAHIFRTACRYQNDVHIRRVLSTLPELVMVILLRTSRVLEFSPSSTEFNLVRAHPRIAQAENKTPIRSGNLFVVLRRLVGSRSPRGSHCHALVCN